MKCQRYERHALLFPKQFTFYHVIIEKRPISAPGTGYPVNRTNGSFFILSIKVMIRNVKDMKRVPCYQRDSLYAGADAYRAIEKLPVKLLERVFQEPPRSLTR